VKKRSWAWIAILSICCFFLGGCSNAAKIYVTVDAILDKKELPQGFTSGDIFCVAPETKDQPELLTKEVQGKIENALVAHGYSINCSTAQYFLMFRYANDSSCKKVDVIIPSSSQIYATGGCASVYQSPIYSGSYDVVTYHRALVMFVYDARLLREKKEEKLLWQGTAVSSGTSGDFRYTSNFLLFPLFENFGKNTTKAIEVSYPVNSSDIENFAKQISVLDKDGILKSNEN